MQKLEVKLSPLIALACQEKQRSADMPAQFYEDTPCSLKGTDKRGLQKRCIKVQPGHQEGLEPSRIDEIGFKLQSGTVDVQTPRQFERLQLQQNSKNQF